MQKYVDCINKDRKQLTEDVPFVFREAAAETFCLG